MQASALAQVPFDPREYDVCFVDLTATSNPEEADGWQTAIIDFAIEHGAELMLEDELGMYFKFTDREQLADFLDRVESEERLSGSLDTFSDVVTHAYAMIPGGLVHVDYSPPNDPIYNQGKQHAFQLHNITQSWSNLPPTLTQAIVAVIDTGISATHPDLENRIDPNGKNFTSSSNPGDATGHGTHVAGVIAAITGNALGVASCSPTIPSQPPLLTILPLKVLRTNYDLETTPEMVAKAINYARHHDAMVINMSIGLSAPSSGKLAEAIDNAVEQRMILVGSAGNNDDNDGLDGWYAEHAQDIQLPNSDPDVITVGAVQGYNLMPPDHYNYKTHFSNWGPKVEVSAHGWNVWSTIPGATYGSMSGTSQASPHVAALAGLIKAMLPLASTEDVRAFILHGAYPTIRNNGYPLGEKPNKYGTVDFNASVLDALDSLPQGPICPGLPGWAPHRLKAYRSYADNLCLYTPGGPVEGVPIDLKDVEDQCDAVAYVASDDGAAFLAKSAFVNKKHQVEFHVRYFAGQLPTEQVSLTLKGHLASIGDLTRRIEVRFYNYEYEKWGKVKKWVPPEGEDFEHTFNITDEVPAHVKSPTGAVRCRVRVRPNDESAKTVPFGLYVDQFILTLQ
ncbi:MAG: S8 family serine peptidase [Planctomycetes bacterium]|nr:S8 family serine peptidase [Planctomycetota bacterium]